jgi:diaminohydroxyphosphoribosylaminopyrimidine deaminase / 5-amino-6-(5-phosphoribosylamino)uracil reductase
LTFFLEPFVNGNASRPLVVAQLGQSLDGRIATPTGDSKWINRDAALDHLHRIRAHVQGVLVGVGTVIADDPHLTVRRVPGAHPARIVLDPRGRVPASARCLQDDGVRRLVIRAEGAPAAVPAGVERLALPVDAEGRIAPPAIVAALAERGIGRILVEGGARTISAFIDAGAIDRLHLLVAPVLIGSGQTGLDLKPITTLSQAIRPTTRTIILEDGDVLFDCDLRQPAPRAP